MLVTSTPSIEGKQIQTYLGIVMGSTVRARHLGTDILATLKILLAESSKAIQFYYHRLEKRLWKG